jgi:hypothetical protein
MDDIYNSTEHQKRNDFETTRIYVQMYDKIRHIIEKRETTTTSTSKNMIRRKNNLLLGDLVFEPIMNYKNIKY